MKKLEGRVAAVTGAASGIGRATARALAARGCTVAACDLDEPGLGTLVEELRSDGRTVSRHRVDVADRAAMTTFAEDVVAEHGAVHVVVNNAGVATGESLEDLSWDDFDWLVGVNFWGVVHGCKIFLPHLRRVDEGHIVNVSSMFGFAGLPTQGPYCATKAAVRSISETLRAELRDSPIGVTSVHPGGVRTNIVANARMPDDALRQMQIEQFERRGRPPEVVAERIVRAILRDQPRIVVTPEAHLLDWAKRIAPVATQRVVGLVWSRYARATAREKT